MSEFTKIFYTVEVTFRYDNEIKRYYARNFTGSKLKEFREAVFFSGFAWPDPDNKDHWILVGPMAIIKIDIWRQDNFFKE